MALCQMDCWVGGIARNVSVIKRRMDTALAKGADIVCFPELAVCGYPPEDLLLKPGFIDRNIEGLLEIKKHSRSLTVIAGFVERGSGGKTHSVHNAAAVVSGGRVVGIHRKNLLPDYGVFDESRYFKPGQNTPLFAAGDFKIGVNICEDIWFTDGPVAEQAKYGADLIVNISASPYAVEKPAAREKMISKRAKNAGAALAFCNMVGAQDELVFDGHSAFFDKNGTVTARARGFREDMIFADFSAKPSRAAKPSARADEYKIKPPGRKKKPLLRLAMAGFAREREEEIFSALIAGTRGYTRKNSFKSAVVGLSGGIDSALVAACAVEALGARNVVAVNMPSTVSSKEGIRDSELIARNLKIGFRSVPIDKIVSSYAKSVPEPFKLKRNETSSIALENIQARIRGNILMAFSNRFGWLVLTTGNKSETSVGYSTLYGDSAGGFAVIKDVEKTLVYKLALYYNRLRGFDAIPKSVIERSPSAELRKGQDDSDELPPYDVLDGILKHYVEHDRSLAETVALSGVGVKTVRKVVDMVDRSEYKRRQSPPGIKLTDKAFGKDRRMPITNFYRN